MKVAVPFPHPCLGSDDPDEDCIIDNIHELDAAASSVLEARAWVEATW